MLWTDNCAAVLSEGQMESKTGAEFLAADVKSVQEAFAEKDEKRAARFVEKRIAMAPEAKAVRVLPAPQGPADAAHPERCRVDPARESRGHGPVPQALHTRSSVCTAARGWMGRFSS